MAAEISSRGTIVGALAVTVLVTTACAGCRSSSGGSSHSAGVSHTATLPQPAARASALLPKNGNTCASASYTTAGGTLRVHLDFRGPGALSVDVTPRGGDAQIKTYSEKAGQVGHTFLFTGVKAVERVSLEVDAHGTAAQCDVPAK